MLAGYVVSGEPSPQLKILLILVMELLPVVMLAEKALAPPRQTFSITAGIESIEGGQYMLNETFSVSEHE